MNRTRKQSQDLAARLMLGVAALNMAGILCLNAATRAPETEAGAVTLRPEFGGYAGWPRGWASVLDSVGFTLMMPGIFFASSVFLGAHLLAWGERVTRAAWSAAGFGINLLTVWRVGVAWRAARGEGGR